MILGDDRLNNFTSRRSLRTLCSEVLVLLASAFVLAASLLNILHQKRESHRKYIEDHRKRANSRHRLKGPENTGPENTDK